MSTDDPVEQRRRSIRAALIDNGIDPFDADDTATTLVSSDAQLEAVRQLFDPDDPRKALRSEGIPARRQARSLGGLASALFPIKDDPRR